MSNDGGRICARRTKPAPSFMELLDYASPERRAESISIIRRNGATAFADGSRPAPDTPINAAIV